MKDIQIAGAAASRSRLPLPPVRVVVKEPRREFYTQSTTATVVDEDEPEEEEVEADVDEDFVQDDHDSSQDSGLKYRWSKNFPGKRLQVSKPKF